MRAGARLGGETAQQLQASLVPAGVRDVLRARLLGLPQATFELLGAAAVQGRDFRLAVLAEAAGLARLECATVLEPA